MAKYTTFKKKKELAGSTIMVLVVVAGLGGMGYYLYKKGYLKLSNPVSMRARALRAMNRGRMMRRGYYHNYKRNRVYPISGYGGGSIVNKLPTIQPMIEYGGTTTPTGITDCSVYCEDPNSWKCTCCKYGTNCYQVV